MKENLNIAMICTSSEAYSNEECCADASDWRFAQGGKREPPLRNAATLATGHHHFDVTAVR